MRLFPRTLFARTALLIAVLLTASQLGTLVFFRSQGLSPHGPVEQALNAVVRMALLALETTPEHERPTVMRKLDAIGKARFMHAPQPAPVLALPENKLDRVLAVAVGNAFPPGEQPTVYLDRNHPRDRLWIKLPPRYPYRWLYLHRPPPPLFFPGPKRPFEKAALLLALVIIGGLFIARRINKPLRQLTAAARELSAGRLPPSIPETGPEEVKTVISAFNQTTVALKRIEEDRNVMLAGISHDLRTPLTRLRLGVELLPAGIDEKLRRRFLNDLAQINDIVDQFSHYVDGDAIDLQPDIDLNQLIREATDSLEPQGVPVAMNLVDLPLMTIDRVAIRRALVNLMENAIKYEAMRLEVVSRRQDGWVSLLVRDDGPGIPAHEIERLLRPFTRLDKSRNRVSGSGLGLAIVSRIAELHGGRFQIRNRVEGGLEAELSLPEKHKP